MVFAIGLDLPSFTLKGQFDNFPVWTASLFSWFSALPMSWVSASFPGSPWEFCISGGWAGVNVCLHVCICLYVFMSVSVCACECVCVWDFCSTWGVFPKSCQYILSDTLTESPLSGHSLSISQAGQLHALRSVGVAPSSLFSSHQAAQGLHSPLLPSVMLRAVLGVVMVVRP